MNVARRILLLTVLLLATARGAVSQTGMMVNHDTIYVHCCRDLGGFISSEGYVEDYYDQWAIIYPHGRVLELTISKINCTLSIWRDGVLIYNSPDNASVEDHTIHVLGNAITIQMYKDSNIPYSSNALVLWNDISALPSSCNEIPYLYLPNSPSATEAYISWFNTSGNPMIVDCGPNHLEVSDNYAQISGLEPNTLYVATVRALADSNRPCCADSIFFYTDGPFFSGNPDFTDLSSPYVRCFYGNYANPYSHMRRIDYGPHKSSSRHTVHTNPNETDPRTGDQLLTVCPGTSASVRLGNWSTGAEAEAIAYRLHIDTTIYSLLLLRYAAVLENPGHSPTEQPRFRLEILDSSGSVIDPVCGMADFIASNSLGWNNHYGILWKDWTTVGFGLSPYHGQNVTIRFTTYDCAQGGHFGYAYFSAECIRKSVASEQCGNVISNSVTAPDGFLYQWYTDNPDSILSTSQTFSYTTSNKIYYCILTSKENAACQVSMSTYAGARFPHAIADTLFCEPSCHGYTITFNDRSIVVNGSGQPTGEACETARWYFGDGDNSTLLAPQHTYHIPGNYTVTLVAGIAGERCLDTTTIAISVPDYPSIEKDETMNGCDSLLFENSVLCTQDTIINRLHPHSYACDTLIHYHVSLHPSFRFEQPVDTFCYNATYTWRGQTAGSDTITNSTHWNLTDSISTIHGCDSILTISLVQLAPDPAPLNAVPNCEAKHYLLSSTSDRPYLRWNSDPHDTCLADGHDTGSTVLVYPTETTLYTLISDWKETPYCPTTHYILLHPVTFPHAALQVLPEQLSYDNLELTAYDIGTDYDRRRWVMVSHLPDPRHDTVRLSDSSSVVSFSAMAAIDSLTVLLIANNNLCPDTVSATLPMVRQIVFAPNVFTPNGETNNRFVLPGQGLQDPELFIYNRMGVMVYSSQDLKQGWDGTHDGVPCPQAAYVWYLHFQAPDGPHTLVGTVTLLR